MENINESDRRSFLKKISLGAGLVATGFTGFGATLIGKENPEEAPKKKPKKFNIIWYVASKSDTVRVGMIGLG